MGALDPWTGKEMPTMIDIERSGQVGISKSAWKDQLGLYTTVNTGLVHEAEMINNIRE